MITAIKSKIRHMAVEAISLASLVLGLLVLLGWYSQNLLLIQVNPAFVPMQYNTALGFVICGAGLLFAARDWSIPARVMALLSLSVGSATLVQYFFNVDLGIDQLLMDHYIGINTSHPGRMAPNTALCFSLSGLTLLISSFRARIAQLFYWTSSLGALILGLGIVALSGYIFGIETSYGWGAMTKMAAHTSVGFVLLGLGWILYSFFGHRGLENEVLPPWLPQIIVITGLTITCTLWQAIRAHNQQLAAAFGSQDHNYAEETILAFGLLGTLSLALSVRKRLSSSDKLGSAKSVLAPWIVIFLGLMLATSVFQILQGNFVVQTKTTFEASARDHGKSIQRGIATYERALYHIRTAFNASSDINQEEFKIFTERDLRDLPGILSLQWAPLIDDLYRKDFEQRQSERLGGSFYIRQLSTTGTSIVADQRDIYLPVVFAEPLASNTSALGFDIATNPNGNKLLSKAIKSDGVTATSRLNLVQTNQDYGIVLTLPIYTYEQTPKNTQQRNNATKGFAVAVFDLGPMIESILRNNTEPAGLTLRFEDLDAPPEQRFLYLHNPRADEDYSASPFQSEVPITFGDRRWLMTVTVADPLRYPTWSSTNLVLPIVTFFLILALAAFIKRSTQRDQDRSILQEKVALREQHFSALVGTIPGAAYTSLLDEENTIVFLSDQIEKLTGYPTSDFMGNKRRRLVSILHPDDIQRVSSIRDTAVMNHQDYDIEYRIHRIDNRERWFFESGRATYNDDGHPLELHGTIIDITERKQNESEFRDLLESAPDGMVIVNESGEIILVNKQTISMFGYPRDELIGAKVEKILPTRFINTHPEKRSGYFKKPKIRQMGAEQKLFALCSDGSETPVEISLSPIQTGKGLLVSAAIRDISARTKMEQDLVQAKNRAEEASLAKSNFLANMSHEIRTPMNSIIGMSYLALGTDLNSKQRNYVEKVHRSAESLLGIINDILDFSKIEAGKLELEQSEFSLDAIFSDLANLVGLKAEDQGIELLFSIPADVPTTLIGDPLRLGQILTNLGNNAIKFTEKGEVVVSVTIESEDQEFVVLSFSVKDTGIGITEEQQETLFKSFSQADSSITRKYGGTGLGLAISKKLTELMHGELGVQSYLGEGSCFRFSARFQRSKSVAADRNYNVDDLGKLKILVVDDNSTAREILRTMLDGFGFLVDTSINSSDAIKKIKHADSITPYQLIVMDWKMPGTDGIETTRLFQADKTINNIPPCILVTAYGKEDAAAAAANVKLEGFLTKPVTPSTLLDSLMFAMGKDQVILSHRNKLDLETRESIQHLAGARILLVEDNELNQELALELLKLNGMEATVANNGEDALGLLQENDFDGILMDCQMPVMDGYTATRIIREQSKFTALPIIAMTANAMANDKDKALKAGMNDHIAKPINPSRMFNTMAKWITPTHKAKSGTNNTHELDNTEGTELPVISGIDTKLGLLHCQNNASLYRKLLIKFAHTQQEFSAQFAASRVDNDSTASARYAHSLKGSAGNFGIVDVQRIAEKLEKACIENRDDERINQLAQKVSEAIDSIIPALLAFEKQNIEKTTPQFNNEDSEPDDASDLIEKLSNLIECCDAESLDIVERLSLIPDLKAHADILKKLTVHLENFDFEAAKNALKTLHSTVDN